jgi:hypothetical protein
MNRFSVFRYLLVAAAFDIFATQTHPQEVPRYADLGRGLYSDCRAALKTVEADKPTAADQLSSAKCQGYLEAFVDLRGSELTDFCPPDEASLGTVLRIYLNFMVKNPTYMDRPRREGVRAALKESYPCQSKN